MKKKYIILSLISMISIGFITLAIADQGSFNQNTANAGQNPINKIEIIDPIVAKPLISKEDAYVIATKFSVPLDNTTKVSLLRDNGAQRIFWEFKHLNNLEINIDASTGQVIAYFNFSSMNNGMAINPDNVLLKAENYLKQFNVDISALDTSPNIKTVNISNGNTYNLFWTQQKNGIPVYKNGVEVGINANTGNLVAFAEQLSDVSNVNTIPKITQDEATSTAMSFLARNYNLSNDSQLLSTNLEIQKPNNWAINRDTTFKGNFTLAWAVEFLDNTKPSNHVVVWLDASTGEIIGGVTSK